MIKSRDNDAFILLEDKKCPWSSHLERIEAIMIKKMKITVYIAIKGLP